MVTVLVASKRGGRVLVQEVLQGSMLIAEILERCGVLVGSKMVARYYARLLKAEATLVEASVTTEVVVHVCVGEGGGMPFWQEAADPDMQGIFAISGTEEAGPGDPEQVLAEGLGRLLHNLSEDVLEIEGAVLSLSLLFRSGLHTSCLRMAAAFRCDRKRFWQISDL
jgi:hypothetical protein